jgi:drug/metabolite transporter (DMT)-like permease
MVVARQGSAFMALVVSFVPLVTMMASIALLRTWPTARQVIGVCGALMCLGLLLADGISRQIAWTDFALAFSVPTSYAIASTIIRGWLRDMPSLTLTFFLLLLSSLMLVPISWKDKSPVATASDWWIAWLAIAFLGVVGTGLATYWFNQLIQDHGPLFAGMTTNLVPVGAVLWGWADQEHISLRQGMALIGIIVSVAWVQLGAGHSGQKGGERPR